MDMEMKKNLAVMAQIEFERGPVVYATSGACIDRNVKLLNWLDEKGFLTDPTAKKDTAPNPEWIVSREQWDMNRKADIKLAILRQVEAGQILDECLAEFNELLRRTRG